MDASILIANRSRAVAVHAALSPHTGTPGSIVAARCNVFDATAIGGSISATVQNERVTFPPKDIATGLM